MALSPEEEQKIFCDFKQVRRWIMQKVWAQSEILSKEGIPMTHELFSKLIKDAWQEAKEKSAKICPIVSYEKVKEILKKYEAKAPEVSYEVKTEVEVHEGEASGETPTE
jgi:hypothetical protein